MPPQAVVQVFYVDHANVEIEQEVRSRQARAIQDEPQDQRTKQRQPSDRLPRHHDANIHGAVQLSCRTLSTVKPISFQALPTGFNSMSALKRMRRR